MNDIDNKRTYRHEISREFISFENLFMRKSSSIVTQQDICRS